MIPHKIIMWLDEKKLAHGMCPEKDCDFIMWETDLHFTRHKGGKRVIINGKDCLWPHIGWGVQDIIPFDMKQEVTDGEKNKQ